MTSELHKGDKVAWVGDDDPSDVGGFVAANGVPSSQARSRAR